jgi:hypothetical protein
MKRIKNLLFAIFALVAVTFTSCDKDVETSPVTVDLSQKATLTGYLYADLDLSLNGLETVESVPVIITIPYSDFTTSATGNWVDTVKTDANGVFTATVPTNTKGVNVTVTTTDFTYAQIQSSLAHYTTIEKIFAGAAQTSFKILPNESKIKKFDYGTGTTFDDFSNLVTIKGRAYAETDLNNSVTENAPVVDVIFYCDSWSKKVTMVKDASAYTTFTVDVPNGQTIKYSYDFTTDKNVADGSGWKKVAYRYTGTGTMSSYTVDTDGLSIKFGEGTLVE